MNECTCGEAIAASERCKASLTSDQQLFPYVANRLNGAAFRYAPIFMDKHDG